MINKLIQRLVYMDHEKLVLGISCGVTGFGIGVCTIIVLLYAGGVI